MTDRITYSVLAAIAVVLVVAACSDTSKQPAAGVQVVASGSGDIATDAPDDTATASQDGAGGVLKDGAALVDSGAAQDSGAAVDALEDVGGAVVDTGTSTAPDVLTDAGQPVSDSGGPIDAGGGASDIVTIDITAVDSSANAPLWLLSIDNGGLLSDKWLQMVDIKTGKASNLCKLDTKDAYPSLTFSRDGILFASNNTQDRLDMIDPCTCKITPVGFFGYSFIPGITSDQGAGLYAIENTSDITLKVDAKTGKGTKIGEFGYNFGTGGATWSDTFGAMYAIDGTSDTLYKLDPKTGKASVIVKLNKNFGTVGMELHPGNDIIYACTSDAVLLTVDPLTGIVSPIGPMGQAASCTNLAAPWAAVKCFQ